MRGKYTCYNVHMLKILIVDDEKLIRLKIKSNLQEHRVFEASNYKEALKLLENQYDLCFIDLNLDDKSTELFGLEILKETVKRGIYSVIMSSVSDEEIIEHAFSLGCRDFYSKGNESASVNDTINRFLLTKNNHLESYFFSEVVPTKSEIQKNAIKNILPFIDSALPLCLLGKKNS